MLTLPPLLLTKYVFLFHNSYFIFHISYFLCTRVVGPGRSTGTPTRLCKRLAPKHGMLLSFRFQMTMPSFLWITKTVFEQSYCFLKTWKQYHLKEYSTRPAYNEERVCRDTVTYLDNLVAKIKYPISPPFTSTTFITTITITTTITTTSVWRPGAALNCFPGRAALRGGCSFTRRGVGPLASPPSVPTCLSFASTPPCRSTRF